MISQLHGTLVEATMSSAVVDVSGVGFELGISGSTAATLPTPGGEVRLYTRMQVRDDAMTLFGFSSKDERTMFDRLVSVSGVGPRLALAVLSTYTVGQLYSLVMAEDDKGMAKVPGVGKKTAQRISLELKDKLAKEALSGADELKEIAAVTDSDAPAGDALSEAMQALKALGYSPQEAASALKGVAGKAETADEMIKLALRHMAQQG